ncbi:RNA-binding domain-containing protein [Paraliomyxa miuraensis]|uniref:RNA-binding domain-containing protein n=1 Tax=Paraliomyxa miuraensis TaxID=376150 RepID=UPI002251EE6B|nr:RNA-binding domain-containing protein [Paraliomyxa miuraensis]MCX4240862.1 putative DNA binding domain-containing protein [Paraliomyxa miuraensis]
MPAPFQSAKSLLRDKRVESFQLEFKAGWGEHTKPAIIKTICAFANDLLNYNGGYVILGVEDDAGSATWPPKGLPVDELEQVSKELLGQVKTWIKPEYVPRVYPDEVEGRHVLVVHCPTGYNRPYTAPERLEKKSPRFAWVRVNAETKKPLGELERQLAEVVVRTPFDAQPRYELTADDLDRDVVEHFLRQANSGLAGDAYSLEDKLRGMDLLRRVNGHDSPLNAAVLFFASDPQKYFPGARIEIVQEEEPGADEARRHTIVGRPQHLIREALNWLETHNSTLEKKHDDRAEADRNRAWPFAAIEEVLVNAVHHRGYDPANRDPIEIFIHPDQMMVFSYPGPMPGIKLEQLQRGEFQRVPARNRHVGQLLKEIRLAEARSSGLNKIRQAMEKAGNPPPLFEFDDDCTFFKVTLPIHPAHLPRARALPLRVGVPALAGELVGREVLIDEVNRMLARRSVCLLGPRGRGVTSLLGGLEAATDGDQRHYLDMSRLNRAQLEGHVADLLERRVEGERLVLLLDHIEDDDEPSVWKLLENVDVRVVAAPLNLVADDHSWWWDRFDSIVVPPLSSDDARSLASRLLAGQGHPRSDALELAIEQSSAGIPRLIHLLVDRIHVDPTLAEPGRIPELLRELIAQRGDPSGLRRRIDALQVHRFDGLERRALDGAADAPAGGLSPDDLGAALIDDVVTSTLAHRAIQSLLDQGWLVKRDRRISLEHPVLAEHWKAARLREQLISGADDIPF